MASVLPSDLWLRKSFKLWANWIPVLAGLLVLYVPTYVRLAQGIWGSEEYGHGPLILATALWLCWRDRRKFLEVVSAPAKGAGVAILAFGLLLYIVGRSQDILLFEVGSQVPVLLGAMLITGGWALAKAFWFPVLFLAFMVPLPGFVLSALTIPLKQQVSVITEHLLYWLGYPIARSGVILSIGQYQLLVADACSGLHSMFSLSALGALYLYLMRHPSRLQNALLLASILPIAFAANVIRVLILVLVTYHFGDEAGQGFVHSFAGISVFIFALIMLFVFDGLLEVWLRDRRQVGPG